MDHSYRYLLSQILITFLIFILVHSFFLSAQSTNSPSRRFHFPLPPPPPPSPPLPPPPPFPPPPFPVQKHDDSKRGVSHGEAVGLVFIVIGFSMQFVFVSFLVYQRRRIWSLAHRNDPSPSPESTSRSASAWFTTTFSKDLEDNNLTVLILHKYTISDSQTVIAILQIGKYFVLCLSIYSLSSLYICLYDKSFVTILNTCLSI